MLVMNLDVRVPFGRRVHQEGFIAGTLSVIIQIDAIVCVEFYFGVRD